MISKHNFSSKGLQTDHNDRVHNVNHVAKKKKKVYRFEDDQLIEKLMAKGDPDVIEHGLMAMDKRISIVGEIISLSEGRDKIFKIFSGILKISKHVISKYYIKSSFAKEALSRIATCSSVTSNARMYLKLFTDWIFIRLAVRVYFKQRWNWLKVLTLGRLLGLALYFSCNIPIWLHMTRLYPSVDKNWWNKTSLWCYIVSTVCQFILDFKRLKDLTSQIGYIALFSRHPVSKQSEYNRQDNRERGDGNTSISMSAPKTVTTTYQNISSQYTPSAMYRYRLALEHKKRESSTAAVMNNDPNNSNPSLSTIAEIANSISNLNTTSKTKKTNIDGDIIDAKSISTATNDIEDNSGLPVQIAHRLQRVGSRLPKMNHREGVLRNGRDKNRGYTKKNKKYGKDARDEGSEKGEKIRDGGENDSETDLSSSDYDNKPTHVVNSGRDERDGDKDANDSDDVNDVSSDEEGDVGSYFMQHRTGSRVNLLSLRRLYSDQDKDNHHYKSQPTSKDSDILSNSSLSLSINVNDSSNNSNQSTTNTNTVVASSITPSLNSPTQFKNPFETQPGQYGHNQPHRNKLRSSYSSTPASGDHSSSHSYSPASTSTNSQQQTQQQQQQQQQQQSKSRQIPFQFTSYKEAFEDYTQIAQDARNRETKLRQDRDNLVINFIKDGGEFMSAYAFLMDWNWSDLTNGLLSINSGCISLWRMWKRYKKSIEEKIEASKKRKEEEFRLKRLEIIALEAALRKHDVTSKNHEFDPTIGLVTMNDIAKQHSLSYQMVQVPSSQALHGLTDDRSVTGRKNKRSNPKKHVTNLNQEEEYPPQPSHPHSHQHQGQRQGQGQGHGKEQNNETTYFTPEYIPNSKR